jgi:DNA-binding GntR family transcriptional regulator
MTPPGTFDRVYAAIKRRLSEGVYRPGRRLEPAALSDELNASVTPVRDALHRLTGERLVEAPRHEGFRVPMMTEAMLRHLYAWHLDLLLLAVMKRRPEAAVDDDSGMDLSPEGSPAERRSALFAALAQRSDNPEHVEALCAVAERLAPIERIEEMFIDRTQAENETAEIVRAIHSGDRKALRRSLSRYHRRRQRVVPELVALLHEK